MRYALVLAAGAILLAVALVILAPASLLDARIAALSDGRMRMANASGTVWNGSGELVLAPGARLPLRWRLDPGSLLRGEVRVAIARDSEGAPSATLAYGRDRFELSHFDLSLPVESLLHVATVRTIPLRLGGTVLVHVDHLLQLADTLDAQLTLQWRDASVPGLRPDTRIALGDVRVDLDGRGAELVGPVRNNGGDIEITGQVDVAAAGTTRLDATLRPRSTDRERADMLAATLSMLGAADGQGGYRVSWTGAWR